MDGLLAQLLEDQREGERIIELGCERLDRLLALDQGAVISELVGLETEELRAVALVLLLDAHQAFDVRFEREEAP